MLDKCYMSYWLVITELLGVWAETKSDVESETLSCDEFGGVPCFKCDFWLAVQVWSSRPHRLPSRQCEGQEWGFNARRDSALGILLCNRCDENLKIKQIRIIMQSVNIILGSNKPHIPNSICILYFSIITSVNKNCFGHST